MKFSIDLCFTTSKLLAFGIFVSGCVYAFLFKDSVALTSTATIAGTVIAIKTGSEAYVVGKEADAAKLSSTVE